MTDFAPRLRAVIYPDRCAFCNRVIFYKSGICHDCRKNQRFIGEPRCRSCGKNRKNCRCNGSANFYDGITALYSYEGTVKNGILRWKFGGAYRSVEFFAKAVVESVKRDFDCGNIDVITFVPQTADEIQVKGFNQGEELAVRVGEIMDLPVEPLLIKLFETKQQHFMPWYMKSGNVFGVFGCADASALKGKTVLLVDDIKTSGKTLNECSKVLHLNGAAKVYTAVIAISQ